MDDSVKNYYSHAIVFFFISATLSGIGYMAWIDFGTSSGIQILLCFIGLTDMFFIFLLVRCFMGLKKYRSHHAG